jgi:hypothetical protein
VKKELEKYGKDILKEESFFEDLPPSIAKDISKVF